MVGCSKKYETFKFSGVVSIVKYGGDTNLLYKQINNSIFCEEFIFIFIHKKKSLMMLLFKI